MKLQDILNKFKDFELLTNFDIKDINISHVTVMDAPDAVTFSKGGEFVLTSGYILKDDIKTFFDFIENSKKFGCSAIGIKLDRFIKILPNEVIEFANKMNFPLINIPTKYSYSDIINPVLSNILDKQLEEMKLTEKIHNNFVNMIIENKSTEEILKYLYEIIERDIVFYDYFSNKNYHFGNEFVENDKTFNRIIHGKYREIGKTVCNVDSDNLSYVEKMAIFYCSTILNIKIEQDVIVVKTRENYLNDFINDLLTHNINSEEELFTRANLLKKDVSESWSCIIFDIDNYKDTLVSSPEETHNLENIKVRMFRKITEFLKSKDLIFHYYTKSDSLVILIKSMKKEKYNPENIKKNLIVPIKKYIKEIFYDYEHLTLTVGIGMRQDKIINIYKSYEEAMDSIRIGRTLQNQNGIFIFQDIEFFKNLKDTIENQNSTPYFIKDFLKVIDYSKEKDMDYTSTLISLIENNWSIKKASEVQYLHYNTIKYRYEKLQQITGKDFENSNDRFLLELGYRYFKINKQKGNA